MKILWEFESRISPPTIEVRNTHVCGQSINCPLLSTNEEEENPSSLPSHVVTFKAPGIRTFHAIRTRRIQDSGGGEITLENTLCFLSRVPAISGHFRGSTKKTGTSEVHCCHFFSWDGSGESGEDSCSRIFEAATHNEHGFTPLKVSCMASIKGRSTILRESIVSHAAPCNRDDGAASDNTSRLTHITFRRPVTQLNSPIQQKITVHSQRQLVALMRIHLSRCSPMNCCRFAESLPQIVIIRVGLKQVCIKDKIRDFFSNWTKAETVSSG